MLLSRRLISMEWSVNDLINYKYDVDPFLLCVFKSLSALFLCAVCILYPSCATSILCVLYPTCAALIPSVLNSLFSASIPGVNNHIGAVSILSVLNSTSAASILQTENGFVIVTKSVITVI